MESKYPSNVKIIPFYEGLPSLMKITDLMENVLLVVKEQLLNAEMGFKSEMKNVIKRMITEKKEVDVQKIVG